MIYAAVLVRSLVGAPQPIIDTLKMLNLTRKNHCSLVKKENEGMLKKVEAYITYGEIDEETLKKLILKRGRLLGDKRVDEKYFEKFGGLDIVVKELLDGKKKLKDFGLKPVFRLHPPRKGFERKGIKRFYREGGALGYRPKEAMIDLLNRMM
jgi:large subunit ribosomal protein L30